MSYDFSKPLPDPRIGVLMRAGGPVFYASIGGDFPERSTPEEVMALLQGADAAATEVSEVPQQPASKDYELTYLGKTKKRLDEFEVFVVTFQLADLWYRPSETRVLAPSGPAAIRAMKEYVRREMIADQHDGRQVYGVRPADD